MKRVFIAIKIDPDKRLKEIILDLKSGLSGERIRWVEPDNIHVTLAFLGDMTTDRINDVIRILKEVAAESISFRLLIKGTGLFRGTEDPRIIWLGIEDTGPLNAVRHKVCELLSREKLIRDDRPFKAHITVGRVKSISDRKRLGELMGRYRNTAIKEQHVNELIFYESIMKAGGSVYRPIDRFRLRIDVPPS
ncbi:MAG TPA: RNA 2',3'-cyclic phosphodiesterase [Bacteroidales bacterium]|nr:RNA 2',3'-cyclic phosphodiesterase [Bacteroidales bacterium]